MVAAIPTKEYKLYPKRWVVLLIFSLLAFMNNFVCYTFVSFMICEN